MPGAGRTLPHGRRAPDALIGRSGARCTLPYGRRWRRGTFRGRSGAGARSLAGGAEHASSRSRRRMYVRNLTVNSLAGLVKDHAAEMACPPSVPPTRGGRPGFDGRGRLGGRAPTRGAPTGGGARRLADAPEGECPLSVFPPRGGKAGGGGREATGFDGRGRLGGRAPTRGCPYGRGTAPPRRRAGGECPPSVPPKVGGRLERGLPAGERSEGRRETTGFDGRWRR